MPLPRHPYVRNHTLNNTKCTTVLPDIATTCLTFHWNVNNISVTVYMFLFYIIFCFMYYTKPLLYAFGNNYSDHQLAMFTLRLIFELADYNKLDILDHMTDVVFIT